MSLIGIVGHAGSGKDTVADMAVEATGGHKIALADPMKEFAQRVFGFSKEQLWGPSELRNAPDDRFRWLQMRAFVMRQVESRDTFIWLSSLLPAERIADAWEGLVRWAGHLCDSAKKAEYLTPRLVLQTLGTEWGRDLDVDMWVRAGVARAKKLGGTVVISDIRFVSEVVGAQATIWRVVRHGADGKVLAGLAGHRSEKDQFSDEMSRYVSAEIFNNGTLEDLRERVIGALNAGRATGLQSSGT